MALPRQKLREIIFHVLYGKSFGSSEGDSVRLLMNHHKVTKKSVCEAESFADKVREKEEEIDALICKYAVDYKLERIPAVEKNLLRLGIFEMIYHKETPRKVAIAEAIRLARKFTTQEGAKFVNAILDAIPV